MNNPEPAENPFDESNPCERETWNIGFAAGKASAPKVSVEDIETIFDRVSKKYIFGLGFHKDLFMDEFATAIIEKIGARS